ncbi:hypothetical protein LCGC14_2896800, partial [marine sediment metagenome]
HSLDGDHENWDPDNKVPTHKGCTMSWHKTGERHHMWKGDEALPKSKYNREWRRRKQ